MKKVMPQKGLPLGEKVTASRHYNPDHLFPVERGRAREEIGISHPLPFVGEDVWNAYEVSWLDRSGKPMVAIGVFVVPCETPYIVESKSLKLYLNTFNQSMFDSPAVVCDTIKKDLSHCVGGAVQVHLHLPPLFGGMGVVPPPGECIDDLSLTARHYHVTPSLLVTGKKEVEKRVYSNLLRTNCPVTGQPDWASVIIAYQGMEISPRGLLAYIVSFREHTGFHENCVERIFNDIMIRCCPDKLSVLARFTRRGGIDINPFRSSHRPCCGNDRLVRQ